MGVKVTGLDEAQAELDGLQQRLEDMSPATAAIATEIARFVRTRFATRTGPDGSAWAPLKAASVARKPVSVMEESVYARGTPTGVEYGATADWSDEHQFGTPVMPARPYLPTPSFTSGPAAELWQRVRRIIAQHVALNDADAETDVDDMGFGDFHF